MCAAARGASSVHSIARRALEAVTGGAPAILAAEHHREFVGNAAGGFSQCSAPAGAWFSSLRILCHLEKKK